MADEQKAPADKMVPPAPSSAFEFHGSTGGPFAIYGPVSPSGPYITLGGRQLKPTAWNEHAIKGVVPSDMSGDVVIEFNGVKIKGKL